jgi:two-component system chemotaxis response regulator CheB
MTAHRNFDKIVVIGTSAGGINAVKNILSPLSKDFPAPIVVVQHMNAFMNMFFLDYLNSHTQLKVKEAQHMELLMPGRVYYIPPNYHALYENSCIILNADAKVNYSRPSIDVFFESIAFEETNNVISVVLTGANSDGAKGIRLIEDNNGICLVQNPEEAESPEMPKAALKALKNPIIEYLDQIPFEIIKFVSD